jgi:hypothetical protein
MQWVILAFGMMFPGLVALADCYQRAPQRFAGGAADRSAWLKWLVVALFTAPIGVGYGILLGYHWNVIKRSASMAPGGRFDDNDDWEREGK